MKVAKGCYGYRDYRKKWMFGLVLFFIVAIIVQLLSRNITEDKNIQTILTVMAILTVLPMANLATPLLASLPYKTISEKLYQTVKSYESEQIVLYDLIITSKELILPIDVVVISEKGMIAFCSNPKINGKKAEDYLSEIVPTKVFTEELKFLRRLEHLSPISEEMRNYMEPTVNTLKSFSM